MVVPSCSCFGNTAVACQRGRVPGYAVPPRAHTFMVAWFTGLPTHLDGGARSRLGVLKLALCVCAQMGDAARSTCALPLFEKERPKSSTVLDWLKIAKPLLPADQRALIDGITPRSLLAYKPASVPPVLQAVEGGVTAATVATRDALIMLCRVVDPPPSPIQHCPIQPPAARSARQRADPGADSAGLADRDGIGLHVLNV